MQDLLLTAGSFLAALAILIAVHEFGHFWVARKLGVKVLRFSIGFGRPLLKRVSPRDGTEYLLAAVPLGGYVKMLDEREGPVPASEQHLAFNRQKLWKRAAIVTAGPLFNFLFAILAYWCILVAGDTGMRALVGEVAPGSIAADAGFSTGDELLAVADRPQMPTWDWTLVALMVEVLKGEDLPVRVRDEGGMERLRVLNGKELSRLPVDSEILFNLGLSPAWPQSSAQIGELSPGAPAEQGGLRSGDLIIRGEGKDIGSWGDFVDLVGGGARFGTTGNLGDSNDRRGGRPQDRADRCQAATPSAEPARSVPNPGPTWAARGGWSRRRCDRGHESADLAHHRAHARWTGFGQKHRRPHQYR